MIFDANKQLVSWGDYRPEFKKLLKGKYVLLPPVIVVVCLSCNSSPISYTLRFLLRHDKVELLDKLKDEVIFLESKLKSEVKLDVYPTVESALR